MISHLDIRLNFFHRADDIGHSALEKLAPQFRIKDENKLLTSDGSYLRKSREEKRNPEYELILIEEGKGLSFVGDSIQELSPGDFMLIGKNLPHLWLSADEYYQNSGLVSRSVYTQFDDRIFPASLHDIPELENIYSLLKKSQKGVFFTGGSIEALKELFRSLVTKEGFEKIEGLYRNSHLKTPKSSV